MTRLTIGLVFAAAIAVSISAPNVSAETTGAVVPPENSAAAQYTEAIPTAGGEKQTHGGGKSGRRSPAQVLGTPKARKLEARGKPGREVADIVATSAPSVHGGGGNASEGSAATREQASAGAQQTGSQASRDGQASKGSANHGPTSPQTPAVAPSGSSGIGETIAAATGSSSSGQLGALLPLAIAAAIVWALAFLWRKRRQDTPSI